MRTEKEVKKRIARLKARLERESGATWIVTNWRIHELEWALSEEAKRR